MRLERPLVFLDIETTGTDPIRDRVIEFGAAVLSPSGDRAEWSQRFNPGIPISAGATEVHHITDADVADCPLFADHARRIAAALRGKDFAGYNLRRLDLPILDEELRRCGLKLDLTGVQVVDAFGIFSKKMPRKLEDAVREFCGREHDGAHAAGADALATLDVLQGQLKAFPDLDVMPLSELAAFSQMAEVAYVDIAGKLYRDKDGDVRYAFGKSKDIKVKDDPGYGRWILSKDFPGSTKEALEAEFQRIYGAEEFIGAEEQQRRSA